MSWKRKLEKSWGRLGMKYKWQIKKLSEIVDFNPRESLQKGRIAKKIGMDKLQPFCRDIMSYENEPFTSGAKFRNGDTIMARITPCLENGKIAKVDILDEGEIGFGSTEYIVFRAKEGIDTDYLYYLVCSSIVREPAIKSMVGSSGRQRVQTDVLRNLDIKVPSVEEQKVISGILRDLDDKIKLNNTINNNLLQQIQLLCRSWLVDYAPFGYEQPATWSVVPLSLIADFVSGYSYKGAELADSDIAMATIKNFDRKGGFKLDGYKEIQPSAKLKPEQHAQLFDTLVAHTDLTQNAEVIGNAEPILSMSGYNDIVFSMDVVKVLPKEGVSRFLIAALLQDGRFKAHALGYVNGTTVLHLSKKALPEFELLLPPDLEELAPLANAVEAIYRKIADNIDESTHLANLRNTLLPRLMSGELDVSNIDL